MEGSSRILGNRVHICTPRVSDAKGVIVLTFCVCVFTTLLAEWQMYANCVYFVIVATEFFTNWNAIEGLRRGDFSTVSHKEMTIPLHESWLEYTV